MSNEHGRALSAMYPDRQPGDLRNPVDLALRSQPVEDAEAGMSNEHALADEMVSVPRQPTEAMIRALDAGLHNKWPNARAMALAAWEAMLSAIPDAALRSQPVEAGPHNLNQTHVRLLGRGIRSKWIGLSDNAGVRVGEIKALGELERAGLVQASTDELPPGPPTTRPREITEAGRQALAAHQEHSHEQ